jgi:hypothetical protein
MGSARSASCPARLRERDVRPARCQLCSIAAYGGRNANAAEIRRCSFVEIAGGPLMTPNMQGIGGVGRSR